MRGCEPDVRVMSERNYCISSPAHTHLIRVVGCGAVAIDTVCCHDSAQVISLHQQLELLTAALFIDVDHSAGNLGNALDNDLHTRTHARSYIIHITKAQHTIMGMHSVCVCVYTLGSSCLSDCRT